MGIPVMGTRRLVLRPWSEDDTGALYRLWQQPAVRSCIWDGESIPIERATETVRGVIATAASNGVGCWTVRMAPAPDSVLGFCGFRHYQVSRGLELLVALLPQYWGMGIATESCRAALAYAFKQGFDCVYARSASGNRRSLRLIERLGMRIDASTWIGDSPDFCFSLTREEYERQRRMERNLSGVWPVPSGCAD